MHWGKQWQQNEKPTKETWYYITQWKNMKFTSLDNRNLKWDEDKGKGWPWPHRAILWLLRLRKEILYFSVKGFKLLTWALNSTKSYNTCKSRANKDTKPLNIKLLLKSFHFLSLYSFLQKSITSDRSTAVFSVSQGTQYRVWDHLKSHLCIDIIWCNCSKCLLLPLSQIQWELTTRATKQYFVTANMPWGTAALPSTASAVGWRSWNWSPKYCAFAFRTQK